MPDHQVGLFQLGIMVGDDNGMSFFGHLNRTATAVWLAIAWLLTLPNTQDSLRMFVWFKTKFCVLLVANIAPPTKSTSMAGNIPGGPVDAPSAEEGLDKTLGLKSTGTPEEPVECLAMVQSLHPFSGLCN